MPCVADADAAVEVTSVGGCGAGEVDDDKVDSLCSAARGDSLGDIIGCESTSS